MLYLEAYYVDMFLVCHALVEIGRVTKVNTPLHYLMPVTIPFVNLLEMHTTIQDNAITITCVTISCIRINRSPKNATFSNTELIAKKAGPG